MAARSDRARRAAGIVVVRPDAGGWRYLVLRAYRNWDFPKGRIEPGEEPLAAALRETREETGLDRLEFRWGDACRETVPYARGKVAQFYVAVAADGDVHLGIAPDLGRPEHHEYRWVGHAEARRLLPERLHPILDWARATVESGPSA
jgi:bis(5'-nucleosidyl)-tetraphosphatase